MFSLRKADFGDALKNCVEGKPETLTITATPLAVTDAVVVFEDPTAVAYEASTEEVPAEEEADTTAAEKPYRPKARKGAATAVEY